MNTLLRLAGFRAALAYTGLLLLAMGLVLGLLYTRLSDTVRLNQENLIWRDAAIFSFTYQQDGLRGLAQAVGAVPSGQDRFVRLSDNLGTFIAGNLREFPALDATDAEGWVSFQYNAAPVRARIMRIDNDVVLLVGQNITASETLLVGFQRSFVLAWLAMLLIGLTGGAFLARRGLRRVEALVDGLAPVMAGELSARLTTPVGGAEWQILQTQINTMLARLENLMLATRQVSDNLAHDLRAPLTRLKARLEALLAADENDEIAAALEDVDGLLRSFNALLTLSRLESGTGKLNRAPIDLAALLADMQDLYAPVFEDQKMMLAVETDDRLTLDGDAALLGQALVNGLENVLAHAVKTGSTVTLSARRKANYLILSLADGGPGIAADERGQALERFVQLDESRSRGGSGLGLSLMAAIAAHHGGHLHLDDNRPGLVVEFHLPVEQR